ncbi:hypothetical protein L3Q82_007307 [Scortum barcoo]|uniref:Uncharacterized protein n=1 Tax=Scortum barcoo TaxID=214431 RepID=A0ACB8WSS1_9TELE|nr:hypothetical protein L3Q82_007307 [Scortum barcoo]
MGSSGAMFFIHLFGLWLLAKYALTYCLQSSEISPFALTACSVYVLYDSMKDNTDKLKRLSETAQNDESPRADQAEQRENIFLSSLKPKDGACLNLSIMRINLGHYNRTLLSRDVGAALPQPPQTPGAARPGSPAVRLPTRCWCGGCHPVYLLHRAHSHLDKGSGTVRILFLDFSSAFNTIQPTLLRDKLSRMGVDPQLMDWISDYLTGRPQYV